MDDQKLMPVPQAFREAYGFAPPNATWRRWVLKKAFPVWKIGGRIFTNLNAVRSFAVRLDSEAKNTSNPSIYRSSALAELEADLLPESKTRRK